MIKRPFITLTLAAFSVATLAGATEPAPAPAAAPAPPAWVAQSNAAAQPLLKVLGEFNPEFASFVGLSGYDDKVIDLKPGHRERERAAFAAARGDMQKKLDAEKDPNVQQDLKIMLKTLDRRAESSRLHEKYLLPYADIGQLIFQGEFTLLQDQVAPERRAKALNRLQCYVGLSGGCTPVTKLAETEFEAKAKDSKLLGPYKAEVEQHLSNTTRYVDGVRKLYTKYKVDGAESALDALQKQLEAHNAWVKTTVLAHARSDFRLPPELYADNLKNTGIDIDPKELIRKAEHEFMETRAQMQALAPTVAKAEGINATDYRDVIK